MGGEGALPGRGCPRTPGGVFRPAWPCGTVGRMSASDPAPAARALLIAGAPTAPLTDVPGVEIRRWRSLDVEVPGALAGRPLEAGDAGSPLSTRRRCSGPTSSSSAVRLPPFPPAKHVRSLRPTRLPRLATQSRRATSGDGRSTRWFASLVAAFERDRRLLRGRGLVYELGAAIAPSEVDLDALLRRLADVVVEPGGAPADWRPAAATPRALERIAIRAADAAVAAGLETRRARVSVDPLVSVVIPVLDEPAEAVERAIRSALESDGVRVEVIVAGGSTVPADPRVRHIEARRGWADAFAAALDAATGAWIAPLDPASVFADGHVAGLLGLAVEHQLDVVYGQTLLVEGGEIVGVAGDWPPSAASVALDATLFAAPLRAIRPDPGAAPEGDDPRWNLVRRWLEAGVRIANVEEPVTLRDLSLAPAAAARLGDAA